MNQLTNIQQTMSSREIAEMTGKLHKNIMQSIRNMEDAWEKVNGRKFQLVEYIDAKGEKRPEYLLSKTECLYIATKFNDQARAILINRWEQLEQRNVVKPQTDAMVLASAFQILNNMVQEQQHQIQAMTPKADYVDRIVKSESTFATTEVAQDFGMSAKELNKFLENRKVIRKINGSYVLYAKYLGKGYDYMMPVQRGAFSTRQLKWTELGRAFIHNLLEPFQRFKPIQPTVLIGANNEIN